MTKYASGTVFEHKIKKYLESYGWTVLRSAGSHGSADLVAFKKDQRPLWIQAKYSYKPALSKKEKDALIQISKELPVLVLVIYRKPVKLWSLSYKAMVANKLIDIKEPSWIRKL